jgi:two-component system NtrC family sensor kinase
VALDLVSRRHYDLVLCDVKMPVLDGAGFHEALTRVNPRLARRFVLLTGDSLGAESRAFVTSIAGQGLPCLRKPFAVDEVLRVVRHALGAD